jgi:dUTP pyrophosphatase
MTHFLEIPIQRLPHAPTDLPAYKTEGSVGMDLQAAILEPVTLESLERVLIPTGWIIALPEGYEAQIRARSGLAINHGVTVINGVGTIDWDYRHEIKVGLVNLSKEPYTIMPGDRIAQMLIAPVSKATWTEAPKVELALASARSGGFGSTGR